MMPDRPSVITVQQGAVDSLQNASRDRLVMSQLGNVVMSSIDESRSSEAGGLQGSAQSPGSSLGHRADRRRPPGRAYLRLQQPDPRRLVHPCKVQDQIVDGTQQGVPMASKSQAEAAAMKVGLSPSQTEDVVDGYSDAQIEALKTAILVTAAFSLIALWFAGRPGRRAPGCG
jgi:hypothetical protein